MKKLVKLDTIMEILNRLMPAIADRFSVDSIGVFGSYVRGETTEDSDLDLLVTFTETPGLLRYIELENYLSDHLGLEVDLVMQDSLKPTIGERILAEVVRV